MPEKYNGTKRSEIQNVTCCAFGAENDAKMALRPARAQPHPALVAVRASVARADGRYLATTGVTTATHRAPQLVQVTGERRRTREPVARICCT